MEHSGTVIMIGMPPASKHRLVQSPCGDTVTFCTIVFGAKLIVLKGRQIFEVFEALEGIFEFPSDFRFWFQVSS